VSLEAAGAGSLLFGQGEMGDLSVFRRGAFLSVFRAVCCIGSLPSEDGSGRCWMVREASCPPKQELCSRGLACLGCLLLWRVFM